VIFVAMLPTLPVRYTPVWQRWLSGAGRGFGRGVRGVGAVLMIGLLRGNWAAGGGIAGLCAFGGVEGN